MEKELSVNGNGGGKVTVGGVQEQETMTLCREGLENMGGDLSWAALGLITHLIDFYPDTDELPVYAYMDEYIDEKHYKIQFIQLIRELEYWGVLSGGRPQVSREPLHEYAQRSAMSAVHSTGGRGYVYLMKSSMGHHYKIGMSSDPDRRASQLFSATGPYEVREIASALVPNPRFYEQMLHERYAQYRGLGEWFSFDVNALRDVEEDFHELGYGLFADDPEVGDE